MRLMETSDIVAFAKRNKHVQESIDIINDALKRYHIDDTCISFNGGKDCTALLQLVHSVMNSEKDHKINAFYAQLPDHFEEESAFVVETIQRYNLRLLKYSSSSLKESLRNLKKDEPNIKAVFVGTRLDDLKPGAQLTTYAPTDSDWPQFMRINPILKWSYNQVWDFIRTLNVPYCDLYDRGYSSIGTKNDTKRNSSLVQCSPDGSAIRYLPAWMLSKSTDERSSRSSLDDGQPTN